ncbi:MAG: histidinol-phosphate transaminase [Gammaproteobacteria bacterium]|jgi:histidinol-phosphate aminotransferase
MKPEAGLVQRWIRPQIQALKAYHVPPAARLIKLDAMENPYGWPAELKDAWLEALRSVALNRYPDPTAAELTAELRLAMQVPPAMQMVLGNGSDELIQMLALAVAGGERVVLAPEPTFVMYHMIAEVAGLRYRPVPLADDFGLDADAMRAAIDVHQPALVFLAYPNNPTGTLFEARVVEEIIRAAPGLVVVDEAYAPFTDASFMSRLEEFPNLLVLRTLSKMGLAGLRLGLLVGPCEWLSEIDKTRLPYNINALTQASAAFALRHKGLLDEQAALIRSDRARLLQRLSDLKGVETWPSEANFILFKVSPGTAERVFTGLRERGVLIKNLDPVGGRLGDCLRVTVGTPEENDAFLAALERVLAA